MAENFFQNKQWFFDRWAPFYDVLFTTIFYQAVHRRMLEYAELPEATEVLDLGCGTGRLLNRLAKEFPQLRGTGFDLSPEMISQAREKNRWGDRIQFIRGNGSELPFPESSFDAVFCTISFLHYPDPERVLSEVSRVLRSPGTFYLADYTVNDSTEYREVSVSPGKLRFYSRKRRAELGQTAGLNCLSHHYLIGPILLTKFAKP
ncbi:class I SAM-dependent methyltransferase [Lyngbya sp. CCY1209]|uniref:class I SAM-dependent methyltransferase n=1 Tax=Lyngbya sp. CCY1209 TaxID=2886103 RepID=UPI002D200E2B|nr:class I SAM-dependent methyltransferase [Lyngbya sp. CCY1209]MEB3884695.1 class I SAM-dependent methyltransferase [Lyngbya sp. CCY1209]